MSARRDDRERIRAALERAALVLRAHAARAPIPYTVKPGHGPVTAADHEVDALLRTALPRAGEGWLSEETVDDPVRLSHRAVWIVDPIDGTRSFIAGRPEYSISIALVEDGVPVLGGVCNPATGITAIGGPGLDLEVIGAPEAIAPAGDDAPLRVLASRTEARLPQWNEWQRRHPLEVTAISSVAYKLLLVAVGAADATWTIWPKSEWDVAAGIALVRCAGGAVWSPFDEDLRLNRERPILRGLAAAGAHCEARVRAMVGRPAGG
ncbi:MAG: 3'(2'),5'-bisphosphate nucleotidase CysQ [Planctomycetota bacterium]